MLFLINVNLSINRRSIDTRFFSCSDGETPTEIAKYFDVTPRFEWGEISKRFFSLFPKMTQAEIAEFLGVTQGAVTSWNTNRSHIPWDRLKWAVVQKDVAWEWLLEGR